MVAFVRPVHDAKAPAPIFFTPEGMVSDVRADPARAPSPTDVSDEGRTTVVAFSPASDIRGSSPARHVESENIGRSPSKAAIEAFPRSSVVSEVIFDEIKSRSRTSRLPLTESEVAETFEPTRLSRVPGETASRLSCWALTPVATASAATRIAIYFMI